MDWETKESLVARGLFVKDA